MQQEFTNQSSSNPERQKPYNREELLYLTKISAGSIFMQNSLVRLYPDVADDIADPVPSYVDSASFDQSPIARFVTNEVTRAD